MLKLAASVWGSTNISEDGIIQTWNTTKNALINSMCGFNGITLCYDELGASDSDISNLIYLLSNGVNKKTNVQRKKQKILCKYMFIRWNSFKNRWWSKRNWRSDFLNLEYNGQKMHNTSNNLTSALKNCYGLLGGKICKISSGTSERNNAQII